MLFRSIGLLIIVYFITATQSIKAEGKRRVNDWFGRIGIRDNLINDMYLVVTLIFLNSHVQIYKQPILSHSPSLLIISLFQTLTMPFKVNIGVAPFVNVL